YILFNIFLFFKVKDFFKFFTVNSFLNGILQCFILFLIFLNLLINVKYDTDRISYDSIRLIYFFEFFMLSFSNLLVFLKYKKLEIEKMHSKIIFKEMIQIILPVLLLNTLLILISRMDFFENGYIFFKFLERNLFIIFFKTVYFLSFFLFIKQINSKEEKI
ncbi:TPA: hypothetical protein DCG82_00005, partial [candidate division WOR-3]|nr:hypothetical protein [candidate division WOR-3 bacterium]